MKRKGASFLLESCGDHPIFIPEELSTEQQELAQVTRDFMVKEVVPLSDRIESQEPGVMPGLLKKAGSLGLLMAEIPEEFGGLGLNKVSSTVLSESATHQGSFIVAITCHTGIGVIPILYYGTPAQKQKYLPKMATGEILGAYALTEPGAGSDALAGRTRAELSKDKKYYLLNGEKIFITNGGFSDLYTVFAKVGDKMTAFLVERKSAGLTVGPEEKKMGIHGSSTTPLSFVDVKVPVENVLGEVGKGHKIAFNILNVGRWKLGCDCAGSCKRLLERAIPYVKERVQFGKPLAAFELIREKIAQMAIKTFLVESMVYRYAGMIDDELAAFTKTAADYFPKVAGVIEEFQIEASIIKVYGSETLQYVADEAVQMHGGYGFIRDYVVERYYRDCRINRIFEGTNEINRLIIPGTVFKRAAAGTLDMMGEIQTILQELRSGFPQVPASASLALWLTQLIQLKKLIIYIGGLAVQNYGPAIQDQQLILKGLADLTMEAFALDSGLARVLKLVKKNPAAATIPTAMIEAYMTETLPQLKAMARQVIVNLSVGDSRQPSFLKAVERFLPYTPYDSRGAKLKIAETMLAHDGYGW